VRKLDNSNQETDIEVDMQLLWEELDGLMTCKYKIRQWSLQEAKKKYAFEVPDIPVEADWVEVNYAFSSMFVPSLLILIVI
jgi:DNA polymerase alpha subunit A